jgi:putative peptide zinc metalloprotease protein
MDEMQALQRQRPRQAEASAIERQQVAAGAPVYILKNAVGNRYMKLSDEGLLLWRLIDGKRTIRDLCMDYMARFEGRAPDEVLRALAQLTEAGFVTFDNADPDGHRPARTGACRLLRLQSFCTWYYALSGIDGRVSLLYGSLRSLYTPLAQAALLAVAAAGAVAFLWHSPFSQANSLMRSSVVWIASLVLHLVFHELAHAVTCKHFGRSVHRAGIGWYYFAPVAFVDTSDMWPAAKLPRILVSAAGPYSNLVLAGVAALIALLPVPEHVREILCTFSITGFGLVLVNLNPLLELDGYYILMDLLEIPNLRSRALAYLGSGLRGRTTTEPRLRGVFMLFGAACLGYGITLVLGMLLTYRALIENGAATWLPHPWAQAIGWALAGIMSLGILHLLLDGLRLGRTQQ